MFCLLAVASCFCLLSGCSNEEDVQEQEMELSPLTQVLVQALDECEKSGEVTYVVSDENGNYQVANELAYLLLKGFKQSVSSGEEVRFIYRNGPDADSDVSGIRRIAGGDNANWTFAGTITGNWGGIQFGIKLSKILPQDQIVEIRIVPVKDAEGNVIARQIYYRVVTE